MSVKFPHDWRSNWGEKDPDVNMYCRLCGLEQKPLSTVDCFYREAGEKEWHYRNYVTACPEWVRRRKLRVGHGKHLRTKRGRKD